MALVNRQRSTNFSMIRQDNAPRKLSVDVVAEKLTTVISKSSRMEGSFSFDEGVKVDGEVKGDLRFGAVDGLCVISKGASVEGSITGPRALVMGDVHGDIKVDGTLVLAPSAVVVGSLKCGRLVVYDGASILGGIDTSSQKQPSLSVDNGSAKEVIPIKKKA